MVNDVRPKARKKKSMKGKVVPRQPKFKTEKQKATIKEASFTPPDQIKDSEAPKHLGNTPENQANFGSKTKSPKAKRKIPQLEWLKDKWQGLSKRNKILAATLLLVLIAGGVTTAIMLWPEPPKEAPIVVVEREPEPEPEPAPTTEPSNLTGLEVGFEVNKRPVIGVMIENSPDARPQSGLINAGIVFEAIAEGGITRFLALYQDEQPKYVGPVRSARPYYVSWVSAYDAGYAHAGGSGEALSLIRTLGVRDLDQFANAGSFERVSSRYAPHNLYTGIDRLVSLAQSKGYTSSTYTGFERKEDKKLETPSARSININISSSLYNVKYAYDPNSNSYLRLMAGAPHIDERAQKQISPKAVVGLITDKGIAPNGIHTTYRTIGSGAALVFQDGGVENATWSKASDKAPLILKDSKGKVLQLNAGQTWITVVGNASAITYTP